MIFYYALLYITVTHIRILSFLILMSWYSIFIIFFLWLIFWSLGSVVMTRFADGITKAKLRGFFFGRSECPNCHHRLHAKNLIPVVSYAIQWGKCEYCKKQIPRIYPVLEILTAIIFVATYFLLQDFWTKTLVFWLLTNWLLVILLVYDLQKYELHMIAWIALMTLWILADILISGGNDGNALISTVIFGGTFLLIYFFAKRYVRMRFKKQEEWFGQGDIFLAVSIWALFQIILTFHGLSFSWILIVNVLILFTLLSSIIGLIWAWLQYLLNWKLKIESWKLNIIPFFPAMILAFWIMSWKLSFLLTLFFLW